MSDSLHDSLLAAASRFVVVPLSGLSPPPVADSAASPSSRTITSRVVGVGVGRSAFKGKVQSAKSYSVMSGCVSDQRNLLMGVMSKVES